MKSLLVSLLVVLYLAVHLTVADIDLDQLRAYLQRRAVESKSDALRETFKERGIPSETDLYKSEVLDEENDDDDLFKVREDRAFDEPHEMLDRGIFGIGTDVEKKQERVIKEPQTSTVEEQQSYQDSIRVNSQEVNELREQELRRNIEDLIEEERRMSGEQWTKYSMKKVAVAARYEKTDSIGLKYFGVVAIVEKGPSYFIRNVPIMETNGSLRTRVVILEASAMGISWKEKETVKIEKSTLGDFVNACRRGRNGFESTALMWRLQ